MYTQLPTAVCGSQNSICGIFQLLIQLMNYSTPFTHKDKLLYNVPVIVNKKINRKHQSGLSCLITGLLNINSSFYLVNFHHAWDNILFLCMFDKSPTVYLFLHADVPCLVALNICFLIQCRTIYSTLLYAFFNEQLYICYAQSCFHYTDEQFFFFFIIVEMQ